MPEHDPFAREEAAWRDSARGRRRRGRFPWHLAVVVGALLIFAGGMALFLALRGDPLERAANSFARDWTELPYPDLESKWLAPGLNGSQRRKMRRMTEDRGWLQARPALEMVILVRGTSGESARSEYLVAGYPPEPPLRVYWSKRGSSWILTNMRVPLPVSERQD